MFNTRKNIFLLCFLMQALNGFAFMPPDSTLKKSIESKTESKLPTIYLGFGALSFIGDFGYSRLNEPFFNRSGFNFEIQKKSNSHFETSIFFISGKVYGEEKSLSRNLNFQSKIFAEGFNLRYNFYGQKYQRKILTFFVSAGIEAMSFKPKADMKDADGNTYYYWQDGTIRSLDEQSPMASTAKIIYRDYNYETDLRDANLDGFGNYAQTSLAFPLGIGCRFKITPRVSLMFSSICHFTFTDMIDNIGSKGSGERTGNNRYDKILYSSVSFRYDLSADRQYSKPNALPKEYFDFTGVDFAAAEKDDEDDDGVRDLDDKCAMTPKGIKVDPHGCPLDGDNDGIPDYRDNEPSSSSGALVDEHGFTITDESIEAKYVKDSLDKIVNMEEGLLQTFEYLLNQDDKTYQKKTNSPAKKIPNEFLKLDADNNGTISPSEITSEIDKYLAGKSAFSTEQFYRLVDFFFSQ